MKRIFLALLIALGAWPAAAFQPKAGWVKVELTWMRDSIAPIPAAALLSGFNADDLADYGSFHLVYVPKGLLTAFQARAGAAGVRARERDELDRIDAPSASIDVRTGVNAGSGTLIRNYPDGQNGLFLLQLVGPAKAEWYAALRDAGWTPFAYLPSNAYIAVGKSSLIAATKALPFVQFLDFYHPFEKAAIAAKDANAHDVILDVPNVEGVQRTLDAIAKASVVPIRSNRFSAEVYVHARLTGNAVSQLLSDPLIVAIDAEPVMRISDERVANSVTANVNASGSQPTSPGGYVTWLTNHCSLCTAANMPASTWKIGIADTGIDGGSGGTHHADLSGRETYGGVWVSANDSCGTCDGVTHGTMVSGILIGNAATGLVDTDNYLDGQGIAPSAGVFSTKIFAFVVNAQPTGSIFDWANDATSNSVYIQNHSHNTYTAVAAGQYTTECRQYDQATRDSDNNSANGYSPILFTVSAGNIDQLSDNTSLALPPSLAKNVIGAGSSENYRPAWDSQPCFNSLSDDFRNLQSNSRRGTLMSGYIKPDVVAPSTRTVSTRTTVNPTFARYTDCYDNFDGNWNYTAESGTSFAAPVAAASALLIKRNLGSSASATSPALTKAAIIANARSIRGGTDQRNSTTIGAVPNVQQGFGRVTLEKFFDSARAVFDQAGNRHFTTSGQTWRTRLTVHDSSQPVVVALVWTDAAATALVSNPLVNDLDLTVYPSTSTCTAFAGNKIGSTDESTSYDCASLPTADSVNNVEVARFFVNGYTQFDVKVTAHAISQPGDPAYSANANQDFALFVLNADLVNSGNPIAPVLTAHRNASSPYTIDLSWTPPANFLVNQYGVNRGTTLSNVADTSVRTTGTTYSDGRPSSIATFVYNVTAYSPANETITSNTDYATTIQFTDVPAGSTTAVKAVHFTELRQAIDTIRVAGGGNAFTWTDASLSGVRVKAQHVSELRSNLATAMTPFGATPGPYTYSIFSGQTIHAADVNELRNNVK